MTALTARLRRAVRAGAGDQPAESVPLHEERAGGERMGAEAGEGRRQEPGLLPGAGAVQEAEGDGYVPELDGRAEGDH